MDNLQEARNNFLLIDKTLSDFARKSLNSTRLKEEDMDFRTPFARDADRIIHALSYTRYINKTQVYSFKSNDHISKRIVHVQFVSKIARTIGRALKLNLDLIEAIALGHDIGHTPLGHFGESVLNEISLREMNEYFAHNIQSVRNYMFIENNGKGLNLCVETLDGIMCHNGEMVSSIYKPMKKDINEFLREFNESYKDLDKTKNYAPMTLEGCVVRISDIIAYLGRDIEDAINLGLFKRKDLPKEIVNVIGSSNREIINTITTDIVKESMNKPYIKLSDNIFKAIKNLKKFNYQKIYSLSLTDKEKEYYKNGMNMLYKYYLQEVEKANTENIIYKIFLNTQCDLYMKNTNNKRKVLDFIAGMTDEFLLNEIKKVSKIFDYNND